MQYIAGVSLRHTDVPCNQSGIESEPLVESEGDFMKTWVLCLNDFPIGAYSTEILANEAAQEDENRRRSNRPLMMHYHIHCFAIDADATL